MKRIILLLTVATMLATMLALAGPSLAKNTKPKQETYTDRVEEAQQYFARPPSAENPVGISMFRGLATDIEDDRDPGLPGQLDTRIAYTGGAPGPGVTNTITGGEWMLCSQFTAPPRDPTTGQLIAPQCTSGSDISLTGTWSSGTAKWDESGGFATSCLPGPVYAGVAEVEGIMTVTDGTVNGVPVKGGSGKFEGTLDHRPLALSVEQFPCTVNGVRNPARAPIVEGSIELKF